MKRLETTNIININDGEATKVARSFYAVAHSVLGLRFIEEDPTEEMSQSFDDGLVGLLFMVTPESGAGKRELKLLSRRCRSQPLFAWKRLLDLERRGYVEFGFWPGTQPLFAYIDNELACAS